MKNTGKMLLSSLLLTLAVGTASPTLAETLKVGVRIPLTSLDPQLSGVSSDIGYNRNIFSALFMRDPVTMEPGPGLATGFERVDTLNWVVTLRQDVTFHNGAKFTAKDVTATLARLAEVKGGDGLLRNYVEPIASVETPDDYTLKITTKVPTVDLISRLSLLPIICGCIDPASTTEDFNTGKAAIGTGPFKVVEWKRGSQLVLERFDDYWGTKPDFESVIVREMPNDASRVASLLSGDVDAIDYVPPSDIARLEKSSDVKVYSTESSRTILLPFNLVKSPAPLVTDKSGAALTTEPLADVRVRKAMKMAINQDLIISRVMEGAATVIDQGVTPTGQIASTEIENLGDDAAAAKQLLADAGYPDGFALTLGCPNDRYVNDADVCQAVAQMWARIGITTKVDAMPKSVYFTKMRASEFPVYMQGWFRNSLEDPTYLTDMIATRDVEKGRGSWNASYSNKEVDDLIENGLKSKDEGERLKLLRQAMTIATNDVSYIPLYAQKMVLAARTGIVATPRADEATDVSEISKAR